MKNAIFTLVAVFVFLLLTVSESEAKLIPEIHNEQTKVRVTKKTKEARQIECLADNIYHEARGESVSGQTAVGFVTMNRTQSSLFPDDVCSVTSQKRKGTCQFSWQCKPKLKRKTKTKLVDKRSDKVYNNIYKLSEKIYREHKRLHDPTNGSLYYHAKYVKVKRKGKYVKKVIGKHIFYNVKKSRA